MNSDFPYNGVLPFTYQASGILFADWINLLTLCLAPLIVHIIAGVPSPVYLSSPRPRWHERLGHYNPTSILWRYFSIIDRRARSRAWNSADMAASNAHFWTSSGWDGSENMMRKSRRFCTSMPSSPHAVWVSKTSAETVATVLQGLQAAWQLVGGLNGGAYSNTISLGTVFAPLAICGLIRLPAAIWISDDYSYMDVDIDSDSDPEFEICDGYGLTNTLKPCKSPTSRTLLSLGLLEPFPVHSLDLHSPRSWRGITVRILFLLPLLALLVLALLYLIPFETSSDPSNIFFTLTQFLVVIFFTIFLVCSIPIYTFYFLTNNSTTTIIPCITSLWYKIYTALLFACILGLVCIAGLETRTTPCGLYTTTPPGFFDMVVCGGLSVARNGAVEGIASGLPFGIAWRNSTSEEMGSGVFYMWEFDGWCKIEIKGDVIEAFLPANFSSFGG
ncbi:hypothetical protein BHYA_0161g00130 [Botrytis hyacinthi]|uniref:Uncharacterized protein n=1 Tax=Botrytis hyacinthi TaxID=278943 RepID=A0A4Z1GIV3_9HELO|nr:hypothetical protein BHYA_0161g00130 [Botrytis hyacinthi]